MLHCIIESRLFIIYEIKVIHIQAALSVAYNKAWAE